ncbi:hypothetical protein [Pelagibacterium sp. WS-203]|uniref:hypothetical protein n=1 Tax=Devosiaceae TaxID=2831106 RepID=UPI002FC8DA6E
MSSKNTTGKPPVSPTQGQTASAVEVPTVAYCLGPKGGIGKSTVGRLAIDGCLAAGRNVSIVQIDRAPTLPALYPELTTTIAAPSAEDLRADLLASVRVFEPLEHKIEEIVASNGVLVVDVGAGHNTSALLHFVARARFDRHLADKGVKVVALAVTTADNSAMTQTAAMIDDLIQVHPAAEIVPVLNAYGGNFRFTTTSPAHKTFAERIQPAMKGRRHLQLPAVAEGAWPLFESAGMTFIDAVMATDEELMTRLGLSRAMAVAVQADVSDFLGYVWPRLGQIVGFDVERSNG